MTWYLAPAGTQPPEAYARDGRLVDTWGEPWVKLDTPDADTQCSTELSGNLIIESVSLPMWTDIHYRTVGWESLDGQFRHIFHHCQRGPRTIVALGGWDSFVVGQNVAIRAAEYLKEGERPSARYLSR